MPANSHLGNNKKKKNAALMGTVSRDAVERPGLGTLTAEVAEGRMMNDLQFSGFSFILFGG